MIDDIGAETLDKLFKVVEHTNAEDAFVIGFLAGAGHAIDLAAAGQRNETIVTRFSSYKALEAMKQMLQKDLDQFSHAVRVRKGEIQ
jgi:cystathionine beta-lyase family protein involved in aluminum resistance